MTTVDRERYALEARAEALAFVSSDAAVRRGESDCFEIGRLASSDTVDGQEAQHTGGDHVESAHAHSLRAACVETQVDGKMSLQAHSDTTLLGGAMAETYAGPVLLLAGMSDALVAGGGMRVSVADLALAGLVGQEEKIGSACADGALVEAYATHFEREYGPGSHVAGFASFSGTVHITSASGFRPLFKVANGVRNLTAGGGGGAGPEGPAVNLAQRPLPPLPPAAGRPPEAGLIGNTPQYAGIYSQVGDLGDVGGDVARSLDDASHYEDVAGVEELRNVVDDVEEPIFADVRELLSGRADQPTGGAETSPLGEYAELSLVNGAEVQRNGDTADVLGDLQTTARLQGYEDVHRGEIMDLLDGWDGLPLSDEVDRTAVLARLEDARAQAVATNADAAGEAARYEATQLYDLARSMVDAGEDPQPLLDRFAAIYRWRAEQNLQAYPNQADVVADVRASIDAAFQDNGYRAGAASTDVLDADLTRRVEGLFNPVDDAAGATGDVSSHVEDISGALTDLDQRGAAGATDPGSAATRDPRSLTSSELDAHRSDGQGTWADWINEVTAEAKSLKENPSPKPGTEGYIPGWQGPLERWDDEIVGLVDAQQRPLLPPGNERAKTKLLRGLRDAEAKAVRDLEKWNAAGHIRGRDVTLNRLNAYRYAVNAVERGEDPLPGLDLALEVARWRRQYQLETYVNQIEVVEEVRNAVDFLFRHNGITPAKHLPDPEFLPKAQNLFEKIDLLRAHLRSVEGASDSKAALSVGKADLIDDIRPDRLLDAAAEQSGGSSQARWQGQAADTARLTDRSTDDAYATVGSRASAANPPSPPNRPDTYIVRSGDDFPFVPPRFPEDVDADDFADLVRVRRDEVLTGLSPTGDTPADFRVREEARTYDLALEVAGRGDDPRPLVDHQIRTIKIRETQSPLSIEDRVRALYGVRLTLDEYFNAARSGSGAYDDVAVVNRGRQVDQLRLNTQSSLANAGSAEDDYVKLADVQLGVRDDVKTQPVEYAEVQTRSAPRKPRTLDTNVVYSEVITGAQAQALVAEQSRRADLPILRFTSDSADRLVGSVQSGGTYNAKPLFQLTEREFAAVAAGDIQLSIVDATSLRELDSDAFELTVSGVRRGVEQNGLAAASDIAGVGSPPPLPPRGGAASPPTRPPRRPRPTRRIGGQIVPIQGPIPRGGW